MGSGSELRRRQHTGGRDGIIEYQKAEDDVFVWSWDWVNELMTGFFSASPEVAFFRVYDVSALKYRDLISRAWEAFTEMAAWPSTTQATDALYFGDLAPFESFTLGLPSTVGVYAGDAATWEYYNGTTWTALTLLGDTTDATAANGKRPFQQAGEVTFNAPTDWATVAVDSITAYWIRVRPSTAANVTTVAVFAYTDANELVASAAYEDSGVSRASESLDGSITSALVSSTGELDCTITTSVGRKVKKTFRFIEPDGESSVEDYP
jgi:hypothetical protein